MMLDLLGGFELRVGNTALRVVVPIWSFRFSRHVRVFFVFLPRCKSTVDLDLLHLVFG